MRKDNLIYYGDVEPFIVVTPNGRSAKNHAKEGSDYMSFYCFGQELRNDLIPYIESAFSVYSSEDPTDSRDHRAMAGLSMGGMETLETTLNNPEMFSYVWVLSASFAPGNKEVYEYERVRLKKEADRYNRNFKQLVFTQGGPSDIAYNNCKETLKLFDEAGIRYEYHEVTGGHSWEAWRQNLHALAQRLFK